MFYVRPPLPQKTNKQTKQKKKHKKPHPEYCTGLIGSLRKRSSAFLWKPLRTFMAKVREKAGGLSGLSSLFLENSHER